MITIFSHEHAQHAPAHYFARGKLVASREQPDRAAILLATATRHGLLRTAADHGIEAILGVHRADYVEFLRTAHEQWVQSKLGDVNSSVLAHNYAVGYAGRPPSHFEAQLGYYLSGGNVPITSGTWTAAKGAASVALEGARAILEGHKEAYALCRPPGHHAGKALAGGFCYLNNAAIAAEELRSRYSRVSILDIDAHHGNGTQEIFYDRGDVQFCSLHADPALAFPWYAGFEHETGIGEGQGKTLNLPLALMADEARYLPALDHALHSIMAFEPQALVVSLGFDIHRDDPSQLLAVSTAGFHAIGERIGAMPMPILLVQEGGYEIELLDQNLSQFLGGFFSVRATL